MKHIKIVCCAKLLSLDFKLRDLRNDRADNISLKFCWHDLFYQDVLSRKRFLWKKKEQTHKQTTNKRNPTKKTLQFVTYEAFSRPSKSLPVRMSFRKAQVQLVCRGLVWVGSFLFLCLFFFLLTHNLLGKFSSHRHLT